MEQGQEYWDGVYSGAVAVEDDGHRFDRLAPVVQMVQELKAEMVLDVGSGYAELCQRLNVDGRLVTALDFSLEARDRAEFRPYVVAPAEKIPFSDDAFDVVTCTQTLAYVDDPVAVIREMLRVGRIVVITVGEGEVAKWTFDQDMLLGFCLDAGAGGPQGASIIQIKKVDRMLLAVVTK